MSFIRDHLMRYDLKSFLGGVKMAYTIVLPKSAASHAKPSMGEAILCMGWTMI